MIELFRYDDLSWRDFPSEVGRAMGLCAFTASKDLVKSNLSGVWVGDGDVMSSDNYRISWFQLGGAGIKRNFLVPARQAVHLLDLDLDRYSLTESWVHFGGAGLFYSIQLLGEGFPQESRDFFPSTYGNGFEIPKQLTGVLNKVLILLQDDPLLDKYVDLSFEEDRVVCSVEKKDVGWIREELPIQTGPKEPIVLSINPIFLREVLRYATKMVPVDENKAMFVSNNFKQLIIL